MMVTADARILAEAVLKIAVSWSLADHQTAMILGLPSKQINEWRCSPGASEESTEWMQQAKLLLRLHGSLEKLLADDDGDRIGHWLRVPNHDLHASPLALIVTNEGLGTVCDYVDGHLFHS